MFPLYTIALLYLVCPYVLSTVCETSYGIWIGFIESHIVFSIFLMIYLLIDINPLFSVTTLLHHLTHTALLLDCQRQYSSSFVCR